MIFASFQYYKRVLFCQALKKVACQLSLQLSSTLCFIFARNHAFCFYISPNPYLLLFTGSCLFSL